MDILENFHEVDEAMIINAAKVVGGINAFTELLGRAEVFRRANTQPIYLVNDTETMMFVTCRETYRKNLH
jgi:hypothetical protein